MVLSAAALSLLFRQVKFWDFEVANGNLGMVHTRSLKVTDDVLCVRYSRHRQQSKLLLAGVGFIYSFLLVAFLCQFCGSVLVTFLLMFSYAHVFIACA